MILEDFDFFMEPFEAIDSGKIFIVTINAHSYNMSVQDLFFRDALKNSDILLPDGIGVVWAIRWLIGKRIQRMTGSDLFEYEMARMQQSKGRVFFLGSSETVLHKIKDRIAKDYSTVKVETFSPPFREEFDDNESMKMIKAVNSFNPDVLFIGMTAPKQEKWAYKYYNKIQAKHICCIGAVFDFYAGTVKRAPRWMISLGLEWLYRLCREYPRMWRRVLIGNTKFIYYIIREKLTHNKMSRKNL
ncbi:MAG: WecB/TagA/CpsF family glycosyltransferase [Spirochaetales bacterium]|jgi:N-acetylglucosaminyldiphosphoundecaprenol N-acetyl-beta-D-mannosaminyltransferase|nr:WecB/TagA/CpsF family glycosyltransferase [Spirochaetales bacterium]